MSLPPLRSANVEQATRMLVSWKEIAAFLERAERTAKRWERERGLPVHRVPGGERGRVFAYPEELREWLAGEQKESTRPDANRPVDLPPSTLREEAAYTSARNSGSNRHWIEWAIMPTLGVMLVALFMLCTDFRRRATGHDNSQSATAAGASHRESPQAEELYLQGRYEWSLRTAESLARSIDAYTRAIVEDPSYARAYAGLAESYDLLPEYGRISRDEGFARAEAAADRAIQLDPNLAAGHRAKAFALFYGDWDAPGSENEFKRALALAPNEVETHHWYATTLFSRRERSKSLAEMDEAVWLSPTNPAILSDAAFLHVSLKDNAEANIARLRELARTQPDLVKPSRYLEEIDLDAGDYQAYIADLQKASSISHDTYESTLASSAERGLSRGGEKGLLLEILNVELAVYAQGTGTGYALARAYIRIGQPNRALEYFTKALEHKDVRLTRLFECDCTAALRNDPGYVSLLQSVQRKMHLPVSSMDLVATEKSNVPPLSESQHP